MNKNSVYKLPWQYNDAGCSKYYSGPSYDCVTRAIAIAENRDYKEILDLVNSYVKKEPLDETYIRNARNGVKKEVAAKILKDLNYKWICAQKFGSSKKMHMRIDEVPDGVIIAKLSRHLCCIKNKVAQDVIDCSRGGQRTIYGYWVKEN